MATRKAVVPVKATPVGRREEKLLIDWPSDYRVTTRKEAEGLAANRNLQAAFYLVEKMELKIADSYTPGQTLVVILKSGKEASVAEEVRKLYHNAGWVAYAKVLTERSYDRTWGYISIK